MAKTGKAAKKPDSDKGGSSRDADYKAKYEAMRKHSREWEKKAKANQKASDELKKLKGELDDGKSKADKRVMKAEKKLKKLKAKSARSKAIASVADAHGVPSEFVAMLSGKDEGDLSEQVERALKVLPAYPSRTDDGGGKAAAKKDNADSFAKALFGN